MPPVKQTRKGSTRQGVNWHTHTHWHCISENSIWPEPVISITSARCPSVPHHSFRTGQPRHGTTHRCFALGAGGAKSCFGGCQWIRWLGERDRRRLGCRCFVFSGSAADRLMVYYTYIYIYIICNTRMYIYIYILCNIYIYYIIHIYIIIYIYYRHIQLFVMGRRIDICVLAQVLRERWFPNMLIIVHS